MANRLIPQSLIAEVSTGDIADDAVTLAKMAPGTDGNLITYDTDGNPAAVATGTASQVLTSNGPGAAPTMQTPIFTEDFTSSDQTITAAGTLTLAHGLSSAPSLIQVRLKCTTTEHNYSVNDEVIVNPGVNTQSANSRGISVVSDGTNINLRFGSDANSIAIIDKSTGAVQVITNSSWALIVKAWV